MKYKNKKMKELIKERQMKQMKSINELREKYIHNIYDEKRNIQKIKATEKNK